VSPPLKFFSQDFLQKLHQLTAEEGGLIAVNTIVDDAASRKKVVQALKSLPGGAKFCSGMREDLNEVFFVATGEFDRQALSKLEEAENRV